MIDFEQLISTPEGRGWLKSEYTRVFNRPPVGDCLNCLMDMYKFLNYKPNIIDMANFKFTPKADYSLIQIAGSVKDITKWSQKEIADFLKGYPDGIIFFDKEEITSKK